MATIYAVAVYDIGRVYGGPEEGGWWFTAGELDEVQAWFHGEDPAYDLARTLNEAFREEARYGEANRAAHVIAIPRKEDRYADERCHMDPDVPDEYVTRYDIPTSFPEGRPHYC